MKRLVIAVDCDDVLVPTTPYFVRSYNARHGTSATLEYARDPDPNIWGAPEEEVLRRWYQLTEDDEYKVLAPSDEDIQVIQRIARNHELHLVTARKNSEREFTYDLLNRKLNGVFSSMEFVGWEGSKGAICRNLNSDILIDDNGHHLRDALDCGLADGGAILFGDYPWNQSYRQDRGVVFCKDWLAAEQEVERIAKA